VTRKLSFSSHPPLWSMHRGVVEDSAAYPRNPTVVFVMHPGVVHNVLAGLGE
jgi:hypothetical protein